ncbi:MAG: protein kinase [Gemmatales bacterium]|nr:protein kinase [Gemmatales bacterium]MCS7160564.1 protein kinase [Gemmatales bacterium]MDW8175765.1 protein kinase [Gemmatales bacterium]MDW8222348.1 protein kinase [Gemmatales bacterium]
MAYTVENYCGLIMRSKLLSPETVQGLCQQWRQSAEDPHDTKAFARWLVQHQHLTEYQAALLLHGYAENFFLGPYKILERIAKGRMAGVYRAVHVDSNQMVALKVLPPSSARDPTLLARFLREASIAQELVHPNIVRTFHAGEHNGLYYLVMEYLDGATLEEILQRQRTLTPLETARIGFFISQALQHLHSKHVVHRDLKPGNIMLVPAPQPHETTLRCTVKLLDVGLAREIFEPNRAPQQAELTSESTILGNFDYLAPEQARDARRVDIRADLYSLGCVLYHCLAGQPPFADTNAVRQLARHATEAPRPLPEIHPQVSPSLWQIIARLLAKTPEERYPDPATVAEAFKSVLKQLPADSADQTASQSPAYLAWLQRQQSAPSAAVAPEANAAPSPKTVKPPPSLKQIKRRRRSSSRVVRLPVQSQPPPADKESAKPPRESPAVPATAQPSVAPIALGSAPPSAVPAAAALPPALAGTSPGAAPLSASGSVAPSYSAPVVIPPKPDAPPVAIVPPTAPPTLATLINVEPVSAADLLKTPFGLPVPRDLFMFLLGAFSVLLLVGLIWLVTWLASSPPPSESQPPAEHQHTLNLNIRLQKPAGGDGPPLAIL